MIVQAGTSRGRGGPLAYNKTGSDCSGTTGTVNRTLSIDVKANEEIIFVQGAFLYPTQDYTKATVASVSQYTFLNKVYDSFFIRVYYWK